MRKILAAVVLLSGCTLLYGQNITVRRHRVEAAVVVSGDSVVVTGSWNLPNTTLDSVVVTVTYPFPPTSYAGRTVFRTPPFPVSYRVAYPIPDEARGNGYRFDLCVFTYRFRLTPGYSCATTATLQIPPGQTPHPTGVSATARVVPL